MFQLIDSLLKSNTENIIQFVLIYSIIYLLLLLLKTSLIKPATKLSNQTETKIDNLFITIINSYGPLFYFFIPLYLSSTITSITPQIDNFLAKLSIIFFSYYIVKTLNIVIDFWFQKLLAAQKINHKKDPTVLKILNGLSQIILWIIALLFILQNFHYNVTTLLGGLGITGIAVAFGLQNVLKDIFSFLSIYIDKPFDVGDSIEIDGTFATVKQIGIRSTRLKTTTGDELIIPNQNITQAKIRNFRKLKTRRVELLIAVSHDTNVTKLKQIPQIIEKIISNIDLVEFKRCHLKKIDNSGIIYEIIYYLKTNSFRKYMDVREQINLGIISNFRKYKISLPIPSQEIFIKK